MGTVFLYRKSSSMKLVVRLSGAARRPGSRPMCAGAYIRKIGLDKNSEKIRNAEMGNRKWRNAISNSV
jgi:hypothetical protein